jgi:hypothetical protein
VLDFVPEKLQGMNGELQAAVSSRPHRDRRFALEQKGKIGQGDAHDQIKRRWLASGGSESERHGGGTLRIRRAISQRLVGGFAKERKGEREEMVGNKGASEQSRLGSRSCREKWGMWEVFGAEEAGWAVGGK